MTPKKDIHYTGDSIINDFMIYNIKPFDAKFRTTLAFNRKVTVHIGLSENQKAFKELISYLLNMNVFISHGGKTKQAILWSNKWVNLTVHGVYCTNIKEINNNKKQHPSTRGTNMIFLDAKCQFSFMSLIKDIVDGNKKKVFDILKKCKKFKAW